MNDRPPEPATDWLAILDATWPAARVRRHGRWLLRDGQGGGQRVSATTPAGAGPDDIPAAEAAQAAQGLPPLFRLCLPRDAELDASLAARGYLRHDPTAILAVPVTALTDTPLPPLSAFPVWPPLAAQTALWDTAGIGPARRAVMARVPDPRTTILGRSGDRFAATAFVALHGDMAMLHALEVAPQMRRQGVATTMMRAAAHWAGAQGATRLAVAVTRANAPACALYAGLGMAEVGGYHYRIREGG